MFKNFWPKKKKGKKKRQIYRSELFSVLDTVPTLDLKLAAGNKDSIYPSKRYVKLVIEINYIFFTFSISPLKPDRWECFCS